MTRRLESPRNKTVLAFARLKDRRHRLEEGLFLVEGRREVSRALAGGIEPTALLVAPDLADGPWLTALVDDARGRGATVTELSRAAFDRVTLRQNPDGMALVARTPDRGLPHVGALAGLVLVVDGLEKPGNLGALLRTADSVGVSAVVVTGVGTDVENPNVVRASQGSLFAVPVYVAPAEEALAHLEEAGFRLVATSPAASLPHWQADLTGDVALLLGTEDEGLPSTLLDRADQLITVPMRSRAADSLNVSVAGAVVLYESLRQRSS